MYDAQRKQKYSTFAYFNLQSHVLNAFINNFIKTSLRSLLS